MATEPACLLIADISGYTGYLAGVELDHAQDILADLMGTIVSALRPGFRLAKLEGDAAFTFAVTDRIDGSSCWTRSSAATSGSGGAAATCARRRHASAVRVRIPDLNLKFVIHHGEILRQRVAGREELLGADVIIVHRLLKNEVVASLGIEAYAAFSQACVDVMDVDVAAIGMRRTSETYEHIGEVPLWVHDLERRWAEEESRTRVIVAEREASMQVAVPTSAPAQVAWEFVTTPGRRVAWQLGVTGVEVIATGNRRGVGTTTHCLHGKEANIEELVDWRPYDYFTFRNTIPTPMGPIRLLETTEFEPTPDGTLIHWRFGAPRTAKERAILGQMGSFFQQAMRSSVALLSEQLDAELARLGTDATQEPGLAQPRPDGPLAGLGPNP